jgi:hypothetical protein
MERAAVDGGVGCLPVMVCITHRRMDMPRVVMPVKMSSVIGSAAPKQAMSCSGRPQRLKRQYEQQQDKNDAFHRVGLISGDGSADQAAAVGGN